MAFSVSGNGSPTAQINITPLIDILLVLIIVFMVVSSMSQEKGLEAQIPQPAPDSKELDVGRTIVIQVVWEDNGHAPALKINGDSVSWDDLHDRLQKIFLQRVERVAYVKGDRDVNFEYVADVIDIARNAGVDRVGLLTKE